MWFSCHFLSFSINLMLIFYEKQVSALFNLLFCLIFSDFLSIIYVMISSNFFLYFYF